MVPYSRTSSKDLDTEPLLVRGMALMQLGRLAMGSGVSCCEVSGLALPWAPRWGYWAAASAVLMGSLGVAVCLA